MSNDKPKVSRTTAKSRSNSQFERNISKWILGVIASFFFLIILSAIAVGAGWLTSSPINELFDMSKAVLLPIVMLILGHYFGSISSK